MHIIVIGAGVVGISTAYYLVRAGHRVSLIERHPEPAREASFANGGQLSYRYVAPLAAPDVPAKLPGWLLAADAPLRFRLRADPAQWRWGLAFLAACTARQSARTTAQLLALAESSRQQMAGLLAAHPGLDFAHRSNGKLVVHRDPGSFAAARRQVELQQRLGAAGSPQEILDAAACAAREPMLAGIAGQLAGGVFTAGEAVADCHRFCQQLLALIREIAPETACHFATTAQRLLTRQGRFVAVATGNGEIAADACVLASGSEAPRLAAGLGIALPIQPLKGYSLTLPLAATDTAPSASVTDFARKIVYAPIGGQLRVAGIADLVGNDRRIDRRRIALLRRQAAEFFPAAADPDAGQPWSGLRPATPDGRPIIGASPCRNLWLNCGHGPLGFTLALASGKLLGELVDRQRPSIPGAAFALR